MSQLNLSESSLAEDDFASWSRKNGPKLQQQEQDEKRPCKKVRGFMLRLPGVGWQFWFPAVADALSFARKVASIYAAECHAYDLAGQTIG